MTLVTTSAEQTELLGKKLAELLRPGDVITHIYMNKGSNLIGTDADFTIVDLNEEWEITEHDKVYTKTQTIPYVGRKMHGRVTHTVVRGSVVMENGEVRGVPGYGKFVTADNSK